MEISDHILVIYQIPTVTHVHRILNLHNLRQGIRWTTKQYVKAVPVQQVYGVAEYFGHNSIPISPILKGVIGG